MKKFLFILIPFLFFSCATNNFDSVQNHKIEKYSGKNYAVYKIILDENLALEAFPPAAAKNVKDFAKKTNAVVAINTNPFQINKGAKKILGVHKFNQKYSDEVFKYSALAFFYDEKNALKAKIIKNQATEESEKYPYVFGGFFTILDDGNLIEYKEIKNRRIAVGIAKDESQFFFIAAKKMSYNECAIILKELGAVNAIQFDGGHSSQLVINGKDIMPFLGRRNQPCGMGIIIKN